MAVLSSRSRFPWWLTRAADTVVKGQNGQLGGEATLVPPSPRARTGPPGDCWLGVPLTSDRTRSPGSVTAEHLRGTRGGWGPTGRASPILPRPGAGLNRHTLQGKPPQKPCQRQRPPPPPRPKTCGPGTPAAGAPSPPGADLEAGETGQLCGEASSGCLHRVQLTKQERKGSPAGTGRALL